MALWAHGGTRAARRLGRQGFVALSPYRRFLRRGPAAPVILTKSGAFLCILTKYTSGILAIPILGGLHHQDVRA